MIAFFVFVFRQTLPIRPVIMDIEVNILLISTFPNGCGVGNRSVAVRKKSLYINLICDFKKRMYYNKTMKGYEKMKSKDYELLQLFLSLSLEDKKDVIEYINKTKDEQPE